MNLCQKSFHSNHGRKMSFWIGGGLIINDVLFVNWTIARANDWLLGRKLSYDGRELGDAPSLKVIYESLFWIHLVVVVNYPSLLMNSAIKEVIIASICCHYTWKWSGNSSCIYYKGRSLIGHIAKKVFKKSQKISRCRRISCVNLVCSDM